MRRLGRRRLHRYPVPVAVPGREPLFTGRDLLAPGEKLTYSRLLELHRKPGSGIPGIGWVDASFTGTLGPRSTPPEGTGAAPK